MGLTKLQEPPQDLMVMFLKNVPLSLAVVRENKSLWNMTRVFSTTKAYFPEENNLPEPYPHYGKCQLPNSFPVYFSSLTS